MGATEFFCQEGTDPYGRSHKDILGLTDEQFEADHEFIQWLFPLNEPSNYNPDAPIVRVEEFKFLQDNLIAMNRMWKGIQRFAAFLGFELDKTNEFSRMEDFNDRVVFKHFNHNFLRITRAIRSLRIFGFETLARKFYDIVAEAAAEYGSASEVTLKYWKEALEGDLQESIRK